MSLQDIRLEPPKFPDNHDACNLQTLDLIGRQTGVAISRREASVAVRVDCASSWLVVGYTFATGLDVVEPAVLADSELAAAAAAAMGDSVVGPAVAAELVAEAVVAAVTVVEGPAAVLSDLAAELVHEP